MARFSQQMLKGLLNPAYQQELMNVGRAVGAAPGMLVSRKRENDFQNTIMQASSQGVTSAQEGNVDAVQQQISTLKALMSKPNVPLDQRKALFKQIQNLQQMIPGAKKTATTNDAKALIQAEEALEDPTLDPTKRQALEQRIAEMKKDPDVVEQYNEYRINRWRTDKAQQEMESEAWLQSNNSAIVEAIQESDLDKLDALGTEAANQNSYDAFQKFVTTTTQNVKTRDYLDQRSTEKTNKPNLNYDDAIDSLPTEKMQQTVRARYDAYKQVVEQGWNEKTGTWNEALRTRAKVLENELTTSLYRMQDAVAIQGFRETNATRLANEETIQKLVLQLEEPVDELNVARIARANAKDPDDITSEEYAAAREEEKRRTRRAIIQQIKIIDPEYAKEKYPDREITEDISMYSEDEQVIIKDAAQQYPDKSIKDIILALKRKEYIGSQSSSDGAFGGEYMSSEHLRPEQVYLEGVRSKISPMGTYTNTKG